MMLSYVLRHLFFLLYIMQNIIMAMAAPLTFPTNTPMTHGRGYMREEADNRTLLSVCTLCILHNLTLEVAGVKICLET